MQHQKGSNRGGCCNYDDIWYFASHSQLFMFKWNTTDQRVLEDYTPIETKHWYSRWKFLALVFQSLWKTERFLKRLVCLETKVFTIFDYEKTFILIDVFFSWSNIFLNNQSLKLNIRSLCLSFWIRCLMRRHLFPADGSLFLLANMTDLQPPPFRTRLLPSGG